MKGAYSTRSVTLMRINDGIQYGLREKLSIRRIGYSVQERRLSWLRYVMHTADNIWVKKGQ